MEGKRVAIFVIRLDRFGRNKVERARAWKELDAKEIDLYAVKQGGWVKDEILYDLNTMMDTMELRRIAARVQDINTYLRNGGWPVVGRVPWGYRLRDATDDERAQGSGKRMYAVDPEQAPYVAELFRRRATGDSYQALRRWTLSLPDAALGGRRIAWQTLADRLSAPVYVARHEYPKGHALAGAPVLARPVCNWEPLVSDEVWAAAQRDDPASRRLQPQASGEYLLTSLLWCPACGARMAGRPGGSRAASVGRACQARGVVPFASRP